MNNNINYNRDTGMVTGKQGKQRMAGEKMQSFQAKLDSARAAGDTEKVNQMRDKKKSRISSARQARANRRGVEPSGTNKYGDPVGTNYAGGNPTFYNESYTGADGTVTDGGGLGLMT